MKKKGFAIGHGIGLVVTAGLLATINALALGPFRSTITTYLSGSGLKRASDIGVEAHMTTRLKSSMRFRTNRWFS